MKRFARPFAGVLLALMLAVTSLSMAVARGQAAPVGTMALCAGGVLQIVPVDADGQPTAPAHLCPDCALSLFVGLGEGFVLTAPQGVWLAAPAEARSSRSGGRVAPNAVARGPPSLV
ncbi:hypothetical protein [Tropicibacter naphthalenivorans]|uniref:DUF2946 domain-containing protein n=1 Tax=Tropicibacter naphthalenivorans TaxID=441103 RepID=A0A0P1G9G2_9RHOB|nr:hypothetical protein [Tropicibacter naphthalenivorans]CUH78108.1 hypothetical protein TRN7648_01798 [Tropicibacter naphthalenivorans]SMC93536.1 hypothetical protein SAMN04488093_10743 [Tropicibacter naphthalenivorans]